MVKQCLDDSLTEKEDNAKICALSIRELRLVVTMFEQQQTTFSPLSTFVSPTFTTSRLQSPLLGNGAPL